MKKTLFILFILSVFSSTSFSHHGIGGELWFEQTGQNQYNIFLRALRLDSAPANREVRIYNSSNTLVTSLFLSRDSVTSIDFVYPSIPYQKVHHWSGTITLANNPSGYFAVSTSLNRSYNPQNVIGQLMFYCQIPDPAIVGGNSNPKFVNFPDSLIMCNSLTRIHDFSCIDPDGDSLVYSIIKPFSSPTSSIKPFSTITWKSGYNSVNVFGAGGVSSVNSSNGIVSVRSAFSGMHTIAIKCEEFRGGVKIGEVIRDVPIHNINCSSSSLMDYNVLQNIEIYPNPSNGLFTIQVETESNTLVKLEIYSINGKKVFLNEFYSNINELDLRELPKGVYFIQITQENKVITKKIVIS